MAKAGASTGALLGAGWVLLLAGVCAASALPQEVPTCTTVDACGAACVKCPAVASGTPTCEPGIAGGYACGVRCNPNFVAATVGGNLTCEPRFQTGLQIEEEDRVQSPLNCTRRKRDCVRNPGTVVANLGSPLSPKELAQKACNLTDIAEQLDCIEGLLLSLLPDKYNSNDAADTPQGTKLVRPAQDQLDCGACAAFAATAAAEAAVAAYMNWNWPRISLSEQDFSFCRLIPRLSCRSGTSLNSILESVAGQKFTSWASRSCYKYTGVPANGECGVVAERCPSVLPQNGTLSLAVDGYPLETEALVKRQIMLNGGVMAAVYIPEEFDSYPKGSPSGGAIYTDPPTLQPRQPGRGHALFCYGWKDLVNSTNDAAAPPSAATGSARIAGAPTGALKAM